MEMKNKHVISCSVGEEEEDTNRFGSGGLSGQDEIEVDSSAGSSCSIVALIVGRILVTVWYLKMKSMGSE
jgi:hypothetical protein